MNNLIRRDLCQRSLRYWRVAWRHHSIIWIDVGINEVLWHSHEREIHREMLKIFILDMDLKITNSNVYVRVHLPGIIKLIKLDIRYATLPYYVDE